MSERGDKIRAARAIAQSAVDRAEAAKLVGSLTSDDQIEIVLSLSVVKALMPGID